MEAKHIKNIYCTSKKCGESKECLVFEVASKFSLSSMVSLHPAISSISMVHPISLISEGIVGVFSGILGILANFLIMVSG